jgi:hypothetical protein
MKKVFFPAIISTLILFIWQFISWAAVNFHEKAQSYTDKQDELLNAIKATGLKEGAYFLPLPKPGSSTAEQEAHNNAMIGKPWVMIQYHEFHPRLKHTFHFFPYSDLDDRPNGQSNFYEYSKSFIGHWVCGFFILSLYQ